MRILKRKIPTTIALLALLVFTAVAPPTHAAPLAAPPAQKAKQKQPPRTGFESVPATVPRPTPEQAQASQTAPFTDEQKLPLRLLGVTVRASVGGHMATIILTDYDLSDGTYDGLLIRNRSMNSTDTVPHFEAVHGLRPYLYRERPDYAFQFVLPGADESVLINLALRNAAR